MAAGVLVDGGGLGGRLTLQRPALSLTGLGGWCSNLTLRLGFSV